MNSYNSTTAELSPHRLVLVRQQPRLLLGIQPHVMLPHGKDFSFLSFHMNHCLVSSLMRAKAMLDKQLSSQCLHNTHAGGLSLTSRHICTQVHGKSCHTNCAYRPGDNSAEMVRSTLLDRKTQGKHFWTDGQGLGLRD